MSLINEIPVEDSLWRKSWIVVFIKICLTDLINPKNDKREPETVTQFRF